MSHDWDGVLEYNRQEKAFHAEIHEKLVTIARLRAQIADAETSLKIWDHTGSSEYWLRWPAVDHIPPTTDKEG